MSSKCGLLSWGPASAGSWIAALVLLTPAAAQEITVDAPPALAAAAARIHAIDRADLAASLARAGLQSPPTVHVTLIPEDDARARATPRWVVGRAFPNGQIVIFPARAEHYPYDSLETVMRHEVVHLALFARSGWLPPVLSGVPSGAEGLPRWFHEGVATSVEAGWNVSDQFRLLVAALRDPAIDDLRRLFESDSQPDTGLAYLLATVLVDDIRRVHGADVPGRIAARAAAGAPFTRAFAMETGQTPDAAAARAWAAYRRWANWLPVVTSPSTVWTLILLLSMAAFLARWRRSARLKQQWDKEDSIGPN